MKRRFASLLLVAVLAAPFFSAAAQTRTVTDMAGRKLQVPQNIRKVYCMSPVCTVLLYTLAPQLLAGWNYQPEPGELNLIVEPYRRLPVLGGWFGRNNTGNLEEILKAHPDVLISVGDTLAVSTADRVQQQTGLSVFVGSWHLTTMDKTFTVLGDLLGVPQRAAELGGYCRATVSEIQTKAAAIPPQSRRRVYYAEGPTGLETEPRGSSHSETIDLTGGLNVAVVPSQSGYGHSPVSMEQILGWDPEIILSGRERGDEPGRFQRLVASDPVWRQVTAVKRGAVYATPQYPFNWIDRPPSVNRIIGLKWLAQLFYPQVFHYDLRKETRDFYLRFYHRKLSDQELRGVLAGAIP